MLPFGGSAKFICTGFCILCSIPYMYNGCSASMAKAESGILNFILPALDKLPCLRLLLLSPVQVLLSTCHDFTAVKAGSVIEQAM